MKNIYLSLLFLSFYSLSISQVVIEGNGFTQPYTILNYETIDTTIDTLSTIDLFINNTGQNINWDITNWTSDSELSEAYISLEDLSPLIQMYFNNETLYPEWFSTHALEGALNIDYEQLELPVEITEPRAYFRTDTTGYYNTGVSFSIMGMPIATQFEVVDRIFKFPMQFGDTAASEVKFLITVPMLGDYGQWGDKYSEVDAEGTLTTPYGTYQTLRVKTISHLTDTIHSDIIGGGQVFERPEQVDYFWLSPQVKGPVMHISTLADEVVVIKLLVSEGTSIGLSEWGEPELNIYPNPATDFVYIDSPFAEKAVVKIYNVQGKLVLTQMAENRKVNVSKLPAGMYFVNISQANLPPVTKRLVIE